MSKTNNLWSSNTPALFWLCQPEMPKERWQSAIQRALPILGISLLPADVDQLQAMVLGEGQFGSNHWQLGLGKRGYYMIKPALARSFTRVIRKLQIPSLIASFPLGWPIEDRYIRFQWEVMRQLMLISGQSTLSYTCFWPAGHRFAFVLTHDIETKEGQSNVRTIADMDERFGFRSSFNFVAERYPIDYGLIQELRARGFEIGLHGLKHDGKLFDSYSGFIKQAHQINTHLKELEAVGFRSPLTLRNPNWMQVLEIEYDLSFFDTDPFEPMPGGTMSIWPFFLGRFVELPYTLMQDYTLTAILGEKTPRLWLEKVDFIQRFHGLALVNTHPDYLIDTKALKIYGDFLQAIKNRGGFWHALPKDVARWWRVRSNSATNLYPAQVVMEEVELIKDGFMSINGT